MQKGYTARLYPSKEQLNILNKAFGATRFVYNYFLAERIRSYKEDGVSLTTHKENCAPNKRRLRKTNRTGERNVCPTKNGTFAAYANVNGKQKYIGAYGTISEAAFARDKAEGTIHDNPELLEGDNQ